MLLHGAFANLNASSLVSQCVRDRFMHGDFAWLVALLLFTFDSKQASACNMRVMTFANPFTPWIFVLGIRSCACWLSVLGICKVMRWTFGSCAW